MGGVDKHDQILTYYNLARKAMKWYKKYFFHLFDICVFNAACLYTKDPVNKSVTNLKYREILIEEVLDLVGPHPATFIYRQPPVRISHGETSSRLTERHFPSFIPLSEHAKQKGDRKNTSRTVFFALGSCMLTNRTVVLALSTSAQNVVMSPSARHHVSRNTTLCLNSNSCTCQIRRQGCQETLSKTLPGLDYIYNNYILLHSLHNFTLYLMASSQLCE